MTKQLKDLFVDFLDMTPDEQLAKVSEIRRSRTIERPKTAIKKQKAQRKRDAKSKTSVKNIAKKMTKAEKDAIIAQLKEDLE